LVNVFFNIKELTLEKERKKESGQLEVRLKGFIKINFLLLFKTLLKKSVIRYWLLWKVICMGEFDERNLIKEQDFTISCAIILDRNNL
jgi:hypothetical protein